MTSLNRLSPTGHSFGRPPLSAAENSIALHSFTGSQTFQPVPPATGAYPYNNGSPPARPRLPSPAPNQRKKKLSSAAGEFSGTIANGLVTGGSCYGWCLSVPGFRS
jgi:hypothetical protein